MAAVGVLNTQNHFSQRLNFWRQLESQNPSQIPLAPSSLRIPALLRLKQAATKRRIKQRNQKVPEQAVIPGSFSNAYFPIHAELKRLWDSNKALRATITTTRSVADVLRTNEVYSERQGKAIFIRTPKVQDITTCSICMENELSKKTFQILRRRKKCVHITMRIMRAQVSITSIEFKQGFFQADSMSWKLSKYY